MQLAGAEIEAGALISPELVLGYHPLCLASGYGGVLDLWM